MSRSTKRFVFFYESLRIKQKHVNLRKKNSSKNISFSLWTDNKLFF